MTLKLLCLLLISGSAFAQSTNSASEPQPIQLGSVTFSGSLRERVEFWDWFGGTGQNSYTFSDTLLQFAFSQTSPTFDWKIDLAAPIIVELPRNAVEPAPQGQLGLGATYFANNSSSQNAAFIFPKEAYVRFKRENSSVQLGRFEFADGTEVKPDDPTLATLKRDRIAQRLIGTFGFSAVQRSFDGAHADYSNGPWNITAVGAIPTRGVFQVDGWGWVTTPFVYLSATRQVHYSARNSAEWRVLGIYYEDPRGVLKVDNRPLAARAADRQSIRIGTYGGHYLQAIHTKPGIVDLLAWGVAQTGAWGSLAQRSAAGASEAGFQPDWLRPVHPWFRGGYYYSTGDGNAKDGTHGTFFAVLPTPRNYARFPFFNEMNNRDAFGEAILRPSKSATFRFDAHHLSLASAHDLWYSGGGVYQPWTFGYQGRPSSGHTDLANLYDGSFDYAFNRAASVGFYYGYARGGDVVKAIYKNPNGQFGFIQLNLGF